MNYNNQQELKKQLQKSRFWLIGAAITILMLPTFLTQIPWLMPEFNETGQIGDTMGGIMGPFISILAVWFTFKAFWVQYEANEAQKAINSQQRKDIAKERFENNFYELLHLHRENTLELKHYQKEGRESVISACYHIAILYTLISELFEKFYQNNEDIIKKYTKLAENFGGEKMLFTIIAYNLFFYGKEYLKMLPEESDEYIVYSQAVKMLSTVCYFTQTSVNCSSDEIKRLKAEAEQFLKREPKSNIKTPKINTPINLLKGNHASFGIYLRQLYQITKFIAKAEILTEKERYDYAKILRLQLSNFEQILLFYTGLTFTGHKWNQPEPPAKINEEDAWRENMKLIPRFKLIKNITASLDIFGFTPEEYYKEEIKQYEKHNTSFFEWGL